MLSGVGLLTVLLREDLLSPHRAHRRDRSVQGHAYTPVNVTGVRQLRVQRRADPLVLGPGSLATLASVT